MDHYCPWREEAEALRAELDDLRAAMTGQMAEMQGELDVLQRKVFGQSTEKTPKMPPPGQEPGPHDRKEARAKSKTARAANHAQRTKLATDTFRHRVDAAARICPQCHQPAGSAGGKTHVVYHHVQSHFRRRVHWCETIACRCGEYIITAPMPPERAFEQCAYTPSFVAHLVVTKCCDSMPFYRLEKQYARYGVPIARSTMCDLFHRAATELAPLADAILDRIAAQEIVQADETPIRMQDRPKAKAYLWAFLSSTLVGFRFSTNRSGDTPADVLAGTTGALVVDAYTGYNPVACVHGRKRCGCLAHVRRKFFEASIKEPAANRVLELIGAIYRIEHQAREQGIVRTQAHLELRQARSAPLMDTLKQYLEEQRPHHLPKGPMGRAISYALNQWDALTQFLTDARIPPDNNRSERALRVVALGRKNFLFVGHKRAGENLAILYTLVGSCELNGINPYDYLVDVLQRVATHPASQIDDLLPDRWRPEQARAA
jgi:transposase